MGIDEINISVDGATKDTFEQIRLGANSDRIEKNIRRLLEMRVGRSPQINLAFCQTSENKDEEELFVQKWGDVVDKITFKAGLDNDRRVIRQDLIDLNRPRIPCMELWDIMVVYNKRRCRNMLRGFI